MAKFTYDCVSGNLLHEPSGLVIEEIEITGKLYNSRKRFKRVFGATRANWNYALQINLWRGTRWARLSNGKRVIIERV